MGRGESPTLRMSKIDKIRKVQKSKCQVVNKRIQLNGHILRFTVNQLAKFAMDWIPNCGKKHICRLKRVSQATVKDDLRKRRKF